MTKALPVRLQEISKAEWLKFTVACGYMPGDMWMLQDISDTITFINHQGKLYGYNWSLSGLEGGESFSAFAQRQNDLVSAMDEKTLQRAIIRMAIKVPEKWERIERTNMLILPVVQKQRKGKKR